MVLVNTQCLCLKRIFYLLMEYKSLTLAWKLWLLNILSIWTLKFLSILKLLLIVVLLTVLLAHHHEALVPVPGWFILNGFRYQSWLEQLIMPSLVRSSSLFLKLGHLSCQLCSRLVSSWITWCTWPGPDWMSKPGPWGGCDWMKQFWKGDLSLILLESLENS